MNIKIGPKLDQESMQSLTVVTVLLSPYIQMELGEQSQYLLFNTVIKFTLAHIEGHQKQLLYLEAPYSSHGTHFYKIILSINKYTEVSE